MERIKQHPLFIQKENLQNFKLVTQLEEKPINIKKVERNGKIFLMVGYQILLDNSKKDQQFENFFEQFYKFLINLDKDNKDQVELKKFYIETNQNLIKIKFIYRYFGLNMQELIKNFKKNLNDPKENFTNDIYLIRKFYKNMVKLMKHVIKKKVNIFQIKSIAYLIPSFFFINIINDKNHQKITVKHVLPQVHFFLFETIQSATFHPIQNPFLSYQDQDYNRENVEQIVSNFISKITEVFILNSNPYGVKEKLTVGKINESLQKSILALNDMIVSQPLKEQKMLNDFQDCFHQGAKETLKNSFNFKEILKKLKDHKIQERENKTNQTFENQIQMLKKLNTSQQHLIQEIKKNPENIDTILEEALGNESEANQLTVKNLTEQQKSQPALPNNISKNISKQISKIQGSSKSKMESLSRINELIKEIQTIQQVAQSGTKQKKTKIRNLSSEQNQQPQEGPEIYQLKRCLQDKQSLGCNSIVIIDRQSVAEGGDDCEIKLWDWEKGTIPKTLIGHSQPINCLILLAQNTIASGANTIKIWEVGSGMCLKTLRDKDTQIKCLEKINEDVIAAGSFDCLIKIWEWKKNEVLQVLKGHLLPVITICLADKQTLISGSDDCMVRLWDLESYKCTKIELNHSSYVSKIIKLKADQIATGSGNGQVQIMNYKTNKILKIFDDHNGGEICTLVFYEKLNQLFSGGSDSAVAVYDLEKMEKIQILTDIGTMVLSLAIFENGQDFSVIAGGCNDTLYEIKQFKEEDENDDFDTLSQKMYPTQVQRSQIKIKNKKKYQ
ncbi:WD40-repeat-containing domain [Pseudocohnilembus persalinus]|uniref:WD40-repeat-containing domain n=1 Tax=Pseudocohnilembus persalinus TaxID=266149 RepID=A0A0V0R8Q7_PSEPJ|nr:WD40-repeat-containing domain [Pseudocohnilembus persalinus]|eukprot:KRX10884.1 WD40-repeat-containing domain [Pseudocohnilembus persalinus]